jgi:hypothetical protein
MGQKKAMVQKASALSPFKQNHPRQVPTCVDLSGFGGAKKRDESEKVGGTHGITKRGVQISSGSDKSLGGKSALSLFIT